MTAPQGKLGDCTRVSLRRRVRTAYRVEWEYDGRRLAYTDAELEDRQLVTVPARRVKVRHFYRIDAAYRWMALRLVFAKRDRIATGTDERGYSSGCMLCREEDHSSESNECVTYGIERVPCRYHGGDGFEELVKRLARWLRWRDSRAGA